MVGVTGFEPATSWSQTTRSTKLSYTPRWRMHIMHARGSHQKSWRDLSPPRPLYQAKLYPAWADPYHACPRLASENFDAPRRRGSRSTKLAALSPSRGGLSYTPNPCGVSRYALLSRTQI